MENFRDLEVWERANSQKRRIAMRSRQGLALLPTMYCSLVPKNVLGIVVVDWPTTSSAPTLDVYYGGDELP